MAKASGNTALRYMKMQAATLAYEIEQKIKDYRQHCADWPTSQSQDVI